MPTPDALVAQIASRQHSLVTRTQALKCGLSASGIDRRVRSGRWTLVHRCVYRIEGAPQTWESRALSAVLAIDGAVLSHRSAAHLWSLEGFGPPGLIDVTVARHRKGDGHRGVRIHESKAFHLRAEVTRACIPVTGVARTILDVCAVVDDDFDALRALDWALRQRLVTWDELWRCLVLHAARGRNGVARYRRILTKRQGKRVPNERINALLLDLMLDHGLPEPVAEHPVPGTRYRVDLAYPQWKIAIECLGKDGHLNDKAFEYDPIRRNKLELKGWLIIEVTWQRLRDEPAAAIQEIREAIALRTGGC